MTDAVRQGTTMEAEEVALLRASLAGVVRSAAPGALRAAVLAFGWDELLVEAPDVAVSVLCDLQGSELTAGTLLDDVLVDAVGMTAADPTAVVLPALARSRPTSALLRRDGQACVVHVDGVVSSAGTAPGRVLVPVLAEGRVQLLLAGSWPGDWPGADGGMAPGSGWAGLQGEVTLDALEVVAGEQAESAWTALRAAGHRAVAHELCALGGAMLRMTVEHTTSRHQFGRALASFQVVKHKLADVRTWQEVAGLAATAAWEDRGPQSALLAKTTACRFTRTARAECQQLLGGMGFSWEHDFHLHLRRALVLEGVLGSAGVLRAELGAQLRETGRLPALASL